MKRKKNQELAEKSEFSNRFPKKIVSRAEVVPVEPVEPCFPPSRAIFILVRFDR